MEQHKTSEMLSAARQLVAAGEYPKAYRILETLFNRRAEDETDEDRALIISYYGLLQVRHLKQWDEGMKLCEQAMNMQFYLPETYINLARVLLDRPLPPYKRRAQKLLTDALKIDPTNRAAMKELDRIAAGEVKMISFLPANSSINRFLKKLFKK